MHLSNLLLVIGMAVLLIPLGTAAGTAEPKEFDYERGDYKTVKDWNKVDWAKIPPGRMPDVPADKIDFTRVSGAQIGALSPAQKNAVSAAQIQEHLEKLGDLSKYGQARQAIEGKYGVKVESLGKGAQIQGGALSATFGKKGMLDLAGKQNWEATIAVDGQILITGPRELGEAGITRRDSFHINKPVSLTLKDGRKIKGVRGISYKNGQAFVPKGATATLDEYYFPAQKNAVAIFFGLPPAKPGNYVAFLPDGLAIGTTKKGSVELKPQPGNMLFGMVKNGYATDEKGNPKEEYKMIVEDGDASLSFKIGSGNAIKVVSREREGKVPLITHIATKKGYTKIGTGRGMMFYFANGKVFHVPPRLMDGTAIENSVAFELISGKQRIITTSSNRFALYSLAGKEIAGTDMELPVSDRIADNSIKTIDDLRVRYPQLKFDYMEPNRASSMGIMKEYYSTEDISANMAQFMDQWLRENPRRHNFLKEVFISFYPGGNAHGTKQQIIIGEKVIDPSTLMAYGPIRDLHGPKDILPHELEHVARNVVREKEGGDTRTSGKKTAGFFNRLSEGAPEIIGGEEGTLDRAYEDLLVSISKEKLHTDKGFRKLVEDIGIFKAAHYGGEALLTVPLSEQPIPDELRFNAFLIQDIEERLDRIIKTEEDENIKMRAQTLLAQYQQMVKDKTGLYPYSFSPGSAEFSATYSELSPAQARKCLRCAQLEFDQAMSVCRGVECSAAAGRYYQILGKGYCEKNPCGPCIIYKKTCNPDAGRS